MRSFRVYPLLFMFALAIPKLALGADILGAKNTTATLTINSPTKLGLFDQSDDSDWYKVQLKKGTSYAIRIEAGSPFNATNAEILASVRDASGAVIISALDDLETVGLTDKATASGTHFIEYKHVWGAPLPTGYEAKIDTDCSSDRATKCALVIGNERRSVFNYAQDMDWFKVNLAATRLYILSGSGVISFYANLADASGTLVWPEWVVLGSSITFRPPADGTYYLLTGGEDNFSYRYRVLLR